MPKGNFKGTFTGDTFEKIAELGGTTAKKTAKAVAQTFNPLAVFEGNSKSESQKAQMEKAKKEAESKKASPLNFEELQKLYKEQDAKKEMELRQRLFNLVKEGEKQEYAKRKKAEQDRQQAAVQEEQRKKKQEEEKRQQETSQEAPKGKERKSIFSPKKKAQEQHTETKPSSSKN